jgi:hypothetical protein
MQLVRRVTGMLLNPRQEWAAVAAETPRAVSVLLSVALPLAALRGVASVAEHTLAGNPLFGIAIGAAGMGVMCIVVLLIAGTAHFVAAGFGTARPFDRSVQLAATAMIPAFLGMAFVMTPVIGEFVAFAGALYAGVLFYTGVSVMLGIEEGRAGSVSLVIIVIVLVLLAVLSFVLAGLLSAILA